MTYQFSQPVNVKLLKEELAAALGAPVTVSLIDGSGSIAYRGGGEFTPEEEVVISDILSAHNPAELSVTEEAVTVIEERRAAAKQRLSGMGAEAIRVTGLPDLADIVADIVEALDLDL